MFIYTSKTRRNISMYDCKKIDDKQCKILTIQFTKKKLNFCNANAKSQKNKYPNCASYLAVNHKTN